ncbi:hypothetical protein PVAP13_8KG384315 [Panicum virgatum]|uniref:Uncharacterized protein n=1 Tax=Panicum virgatum TaxID=38727 RepID=A0A8T0PR11_PANVG|nr:hypothetical protein PVAP13_8KG384315 [Panicum virgatum]
MRASGLAALSPRRWPRWHDVAAVSGPTGLGGGDSDSSCNSFLARSACGHRAGASSPTQRSPQGRFRARPPPTTPRAGDGAKSMEVLDRGWTSLGQTDPSSAGGELWVMMHRFRCKTRFQQGASEQ